MHVTAGELFEAEVPVPPLTWDTLYGARIEDAVTRAVVFPWTAAELQRYPGDPMNPDDPTRWTWKVTLTAPAAAGEHLLVWGRTDGSAPIIEPLFVEPAVAALTFPPPDLPAITPGADEVAALMRTRVVTEGGEEVDQATFDETTHPTVAEVNRLIVTARNGVLAALPNTFDPRHYDGVRHLVTLYTVVLGEGSYFREQVDDSGVSVWQRLYSNGLAALQGRMDQDRAQADLLGGMEPRAA